MEKYSHGHGVMSYLARKLRGGPISNSRIIIPPSFHFGGISSTCYLRDLSRFGAWDCIPTVRAREILRYAGLFLVSRSMQVMNPFRVGRMYCPVVLLMVVIE